MKSYDVHLKNQNKKLSAICPNCHTELDIDWRDFDYSIGNVSVYHLWCEKCDAEIYASKAFEKE